MLNQYVTNAKCLMSRADPVIRGLLRPHLAKLQAEVGGKSGITIKRSTEAIHETWETGLTTRPTGRRKKLRDD